MKRIKYPLIIFVSCCIIFKSILASPAPRNVVDNPLRFAVVTYVGDVQQERMAKVLIRSIRELGGKFKNCTIYVALADVENVPCHSLQGENVNLVTLNLDSRIIEYPLAVKAYAAAKVEDLVRKRIRTLAWFDPETIVLGPLDDLVLNASMSAAVKPVFLVNSIGLPEHQNADEYWDPIYRLMNLETMAVPIVRSIIEDVPIRAYYNCEVFSIDPKHRIFKTWAKILGQLLKDEMYQRTVCTTFLRKLFLHQAVLSAVIVSRSGAERIQPLPLSCGYPLNVHERMPVAKKALLLNHISCAILENVWQRNPDWMQLINIEEPLRSWLDDVYQDYLNTRKTEPKIL